MISTKRYCSARTYGFVRRDMLAKDMDSKQHHLDTEGTEGLREQAKWSTMKLLHLPRSHRTTSGALNETPKCVTRVTSVAFWCPSRGCSKEMTRRHVLGHSANGSRSSTMHAPPAEDQWHARDPLLACFPTLTKISTRSSDHPFTAGGEVACQGPAVWLFAHVLHGMIFQTHRAPSSSLSYDKLFERAEPIHCSSCSSTLAALVPLLKWTRARTAPMPD